MTDPHAHRPADELRSVLNSIGASIAAVAASLAVAPIEQAFAQAKQVGPAVQQVMDGFPPCNPRFSLIDVSPDVWHPCVRNAKITGQAMDVDIEVVLSAQEPVVFLLAQGPPCTPGWMLPGSIALQVTGELGTANVYLLSGATTWQLAGSINTRYHETGVYAYPVASGSIGGVRFLSLAPGSNRFVSVQVVQAAPAWIQTGAFFKAVEWNAREIDWATASPLFIGAAAFDAGQDIIAFVNGRLAQGRGAEVRPRSPELVADIYLHWGYFTGTPNAQTLGSFRAFRIIRAP